jgi:hypothetical protein
MASLTRLNRRLNRWDRYTFRYHDATVIGYGHWRAWRAVQDERKRRGLSHASDDTTAMMAALVVLGRS